MVHCSLTEDPHVLMLLSNRSSYTRVYVPTIFDSRASDHCFTNENNFGSYTAYPKSCCKALVEKNTQFKIMGKGIIIIKSQMDNRRLTNIMLE